MLQVITLIIIALLVAIDQIIKLLVLEHLKPMGSLTLIDGFIQLNYAENTGAAFGSFSGKTTFLSIFTLAIIILGLIYLFVKKRKVDVEYICISLIISGGLGNLVDRIFRGYVVDYISINIFGYHFPIFNFADMCIVISVILIFVSAIKGDLWRE